MRVAIEIGELRPEFARHCVGQGLVILLLMCVSPMLPLFEPLPDSYLTLVPKRWVAKIVR